MIWNDLEKDGQRWVNGIIAMNFVVCSGVLLGFHSLEWDKLGGLGGFFGGICSPLLGVFTATLLYAAFKKQSKATQLQAEATSLQAEATRLQSELFQAEQQKRKKDEANRIIEDGILRLERILERACYVRIDVGGVRNPYRGADGVYRFCVDCKSGGSGPYSSNELMLDNLRHWLFDASVILRRAWEFDQSCFDELCVRVQSLYSFTLVKSLNTLPKSSSMDDSFKTDLEQLWVVKAMFDRALNGQFESADQA